MMDHTKKKINKVKDEEEEEEEEEHRPSLSKSQQLTIINHHHHHHRRRRRNTNRQRRIVADVTTSLWWLMAMMMFPFSMNKMGTLITTTTTTTLKFTTLTTSSISTFTIRPTAVVMAFNAGYFYPRPSSSSSSKIGRIRRSTSTTGTLSRTLQREQQSRIRSSWITTTSNRSCERGSLSSYSSSRQYFRYSPLLRMTTASSSSSSSASPPPPPEKSEPTTNDATTLSPTTTTQCVGLTFEPYLSLSVPTSFDMEELGALLSVLSRPRDIILLDGDLGAGKTTFSRGFIHCKMGVDMDNDDDDEGDDYEKEGGGDDETDVVDEEEEPSTLSTKNDIFRVTSPTYLLSNTYIYHDGESSTDVEREIHHMDLYRLDGETYQEFEPLNLPYVFDECISLIEWPSRLDKVARDIHEILPFPINCHLLKVDLRIRPASDERIMTISVCCSDSRENDDESKQPSSSSSSHTSSSWQDRLDHLVQEGMVNDLIVDP